MKNYLYKNRIGISLALFFLVIVPGVFVGTQMISTRLESGKKELAKNELAQHVRTEQISNIDKFRKQEKVIREKRSELAVFLKNSDEAKVQLADRIDTIAGEENLIVEISAGEEVLRADRKQDAENTTSNQKTVSQDRGAPTATDAQSEETLAEQSFVAPAGESYITLVITTTGRFNDVTRFLHKIEYMEYFSDVLSISLNRTLQRQSNDRVGGTQENAGDQEQGAVKAKIEVIFYLE